jgi:hypothetical protein
MTNQQRSAHFQKGLIATGYQSLWILVRSRQNYRIQRKRIFVRHTRRVFGGMCLVNTISINFGMYDCLFFFALRDKIPKSVAYFIRHASSIMPPHYPSDFKDSGLNLKQLSSFSSMQIIEITVGDFRFSLNCCNLLSVWTAMPLPRQSEQPQKGRV